MGVLVPEDFDLQELANDEERRVVEACVHGLSDGWLVLPDVGIKAGTRDHQLDVVLVHEDFGVLDLEVKGHRPEVRQGTWYAHGSTMNPQPPRQAHENAYALRNFVRSRVEDLGRLKVPYAVVLPNVAELVGQLGPELKPEQVITGSMLDDVVDAVEQVALLWANAQPLDADDVTRIVQALRPDAGFTWDPGARAAFARRRLDELCRAQVKALETLDANRRVLVTGAAGTGKTRLAEGWARRAVWDGERVLFTCFNEPLADAVRGRLPESDELTVGPFLRLALELPGMPPLVEPPDADAAWWNGPVHDHIEAHWDEVTARYDRIVVDEGQDFSPRWMAWLERLLDPEGAGQVLVVADEAQDLYHRRFDEVDVDGWARCELVSNCRNAQQIAGLLRRHFGGAAAPSVMPEAVGLRSVVVDAGDADAVAEAVGEELRWLLDDEQRDPAKVAVLTFHRTMRDLLGDRHGLARWEDRGDGDVLGETVHRVKGLEVDTVVLVTDRPEHDVLLYVGVSRAVSELVVVAPVDVTERLGLG
ncbi:MAG: NERD domain-containing protein [Acidimicrobiales bacterium]|nr:NERD domain-containing protein [Acidimicrobiales bacterium]